MKSALLCLQHRGPNDSGFEITSVNGASLVLGHTRLSIIDLSSAGHQPMYSPDRKYSVVFNGEIYNYKELRQQLSVLGYVFKSGSDTEVLLAAWQHWKEESISRFVGMFAFVVCDHESGTVHCVRDAYGIKPFFYSREGSALVFASEISAIKSLKRDAVELNWQRSYDYLVHGDYDSNEQTFFKDVFHLPAGHKFSFHISSGEMTSPQPWFTPKLELRTDLNFTDAADELRERFLENIRLHLRSDVPLGAALSGGLDSSAVVCAMHHVAPEMPIHTFSYIAKGSALSEEHWVDEVSRHVGAQAHKVIVSSADLIRDLDDMIRVQGEPFGTTSIYAQYRVYQLAEEKGVTVTLDGQGADEMLAGYNGYPGQRIRSLVERGEWARAAYFLKEWSKWPGRSLKLGVGTALGQFTSGKLNELLHRMDGKNSAPSWLNTGALNDAGVKRGSTRRFCPIDLKGRRVTAELAASLHTRGLQHLLRHGDRNSMRFSIESRVPFLTTGLSEFLLSLPEHFLISDSGETKHIFRAAMRGIVPDYVLNRRDKVGFETPEKDFILANSELLRAWLVEDLGLPFLNSSELVTEFDRVILGQVRYTSQVWRWINFYRWYRVTFS
ncbi:asparagine synthase (glutamine-hydrolyzing) [Pseudomonas sp. AA-38]|uniref:asparagine synthase (glutamine-hydrolyzing) n=1 Tax=Pseudomonas sp. AA-38 TaxID=3028807 RepID=UPI0023F9456E|nr:asparagine synthase (glutamine-hydrolyzing) [Pseudomonas sp. AA-38]